MELEEKIEIATKKITSLGLLDIAEVKTLQQYSN
jgi:hypothetical protein